MISFPDGFDITLLVSDVVALATPFIEIAVIFFAYKLIRKALRS